jgi:hypothetical protein
MATICARRQRHRPDLVGGAADPATTGTIPSDAMHVCSKPPGWHLGSGRRCASKAGVPLGVLGLDHQRQTIERTGRSADAAGACAPSASRSTIKNYPGSLLFARDGPIYQAARTTRSSPSRPTRPTPTTKGMWSGAFIPPHGTNTSWFDDPIVNRTSHAATLTYDRARRRALYQAGRSAHPRPGAGGLLLLAERVLGLEQRCARGWKPATYISSFWNCWQWSV